eukprot:2795584-Heterocapsa_arctica.AAC.1
MLDGTQHSATDTAKRFWRVRAGLLHAVRRGRLSGRALEVLIGHATFCGLSNRPVLSVFHTVY